MCLHRSTIYPHGCLLPSSYGLLCRLCFSTTMCCRMLISNLQRLVLDIPKIDAFICYPPGGWVVWSRFYADITDIVSQSVKTPNLQHLVNTFYFCRLCFSTTSCTACRFQTCSDTCTRSQTWMPLHSFVICLVSPLQIAGHLSTGRAPARRRLTYASQSVQPTATCRTLPTLFLSAGCASA